MNFKPKSTSVILQLAMMVFLTMLLAYCAINKHFVLLVINFVLLVYASVLLYRKVANATAELVYYFEGIINNDTSMAIKRYKALPNSTLLIETVDRLRAKIKSERKQNQIKEHFYEELIKHTTTGLLAYNNENGLVSIINPAFLKLLNTSHISSLKTIKNQYPQLFQLISNFNANKPAMYKMPNEIEVQVKMSNFNFENSEYKLFAFQNIKNELDEKEVESWQKLFRILSHEIMNYIAPITSLAQSISSTPINNQFQDIDFQRILESAATIEEQSRQMMLFVEKYREFYKLPDPILRPINVADWLSRFSVLYHQQMQELRIKFDVYPSEIEQFIADENLISRVVINLLRNAQQAVEGKIGAIIKLGIISRNNQIIITVEDNGEGINPQYADQIFMPFFTTRSGGSGIGLAISRQIVQRHGGTISFAARLGGGTIFTVIL